MPKRGQTWRPLAHRFRKHREDALIIGDGNDIGPEHYGRDLDAKVKGDPERDRLEIGWIRRALEDSILLLGTKQAINNKELNHLSILRTCANRYNFCIAVLSQ